MRRLWQPLPGINSLPDSYASTLSVDEKPSACISSTENEFDWNDDQTNWANGYIWERPPNQPMSPMSQSKPVWMRSLCPIVVWLPAKIDGTSLSRSNSRLQHIAHSVYIQWATSPHFLPIFFRKSLEGHNMKFAIVALSVALVVSIPVQFIAYPWII